MEIIEFFSKNKLKKRVFKDDFYGIIKSKISDEFDINEKYLLLFNEKNKILDFTYNRDLFLPQNFLNEDILLDIDDDMFSDNSSFTPENNTIFFISINDIIPNEWYSIIPNNIRYIWNKIIKIYWPFLSFEEFIETINGNILKKIEGNNIFDVIIEEIIDSESTIISENVRLINNKKHLYIIDPVDLKYIFNKIKLSNKNTIAIYKEDNFYIKKVYKHTTKIEKIQIPYKNGIQIGLFNFLNNSFGNFLDEDLFNLILKLLKSRNIRYKVYNINTYAFKVILNNDILTISKVNKLLDGTTLFERKIDNIGNKNFYVGTYKRSSFHSNSNINGSIIYIKNNSGKILNITIKNCLFRRDAVYLRNFIVKLFSLYDKSIKKTDFISVKTIKQNLKIIDPKLYLYNSKNIEGYILYSRRITKKRHPIAFWSDSPVYVEYKKRLKNNNIIFSEKKIKNETFSDIKTIYICINNLRIKFLEKTTHPNNLSQVECGRYTIKEKQKLTLNRWYIRNYNQIKKLDEKKLSRLPEILEKLLNKVPVVSYIKNDSSVYLLYGLKGGSLSEIINEILVDEKFQMTNKENEIELINYCRNKDLNIHLLHDDNDKIKIHLVFDNYEKRNKNIVILLTTKVLGNNLYKQYNLLCKVTLKNKRYQIEKILKKNDKGIIKMEKIYKFLEKKNINKRKKQSHPTLYMLKKFFPKIEQIVLNDNIVEYVYILKNNKRIKFPIVPQLYNSKIEVYKNFKNIIPTKIEIDYVLKKIMIDIKEIYINNEGKMFSYLLNSGYFIFFKPIKLQTHRQTKKWFINGSKISFKYNNIFYIKELYWILLLHLSHEINKKNLKRIKKMKEMKIVEIYPFLKKHMDDKYAIDDYKKIKLGKFKNLIFLSPFKIKFINIKKSKALYNFLLKLSNKFVVVDNNKNKGKLSGEIYRFLCHEDMDSTIYNQCKNKKLRIDNKDILHNLIKMISVDLLNNQRRREQFIKNKLPRGITTTQISYDEDSIITWGIV
jgi:hypothetical protein